MLVMQSSLGSCLAYSEVYPGSIKLAGCANETTYLNFQSWEGSALCDFNTFEAVFNQTCAEAQADYGEYGLGACANEILFPAVPISDNTPLDINVPLDVGDTPIGHSSASDGKLRGGLLAAAISLIALF